MNIRPITPFDVLRIRRVHEKYFNEEFEFPNFFERFLSAYLVEDDKEQIIAACGVRPIAEAVLITNKDKSVRVRREALFKILHASMFVCNRLGYDQLHAFVQDDSWKKHLENVGFEPTKGQSLVIGV